MPSETTTLLFLHTFTMQKVMYTTAQKVDTVQELINAIGHDTVATEENYIRLFGNVLNAMIDELGWDKSRKGENIQNHVFREYIKREFLPQYCNMLDLDVVNYINAVDDRFNGISTF